MKRRFYKKYLVNMADSASTQRVEDNNDLMQFGVILFLNKQHDLQDANKMYIRTHFAIDDISKSYLVDKEIDTFSDNKFASKNMNVTVKNKNIYNCCKKYLTKTKYNNINRLLITIYFILNLS